MWDIEHVRLCGTMSHAKLLHRPAIYYQVTFCLAFWVWLGKVNFDYFRQSASTYTSLRLTHGHWLQHLRLQQTNSLPCSASVRLFINCFHRERATFILLLVLWMTSRLLWTAGHVHELICFRNWKPCLLNWSSSDKSNVVSVKSNMSPLSLWLLVFRNAGLNNPFLWCFCLFFCRRRTFNFHRCFWWWSVPTEVWSVLQRFLSLREFAINFSARKRKFGWIKWIRVN